MRIALVMNLAPRKLGSLEDWAVAFCREAVWQGHVIDAYGRQPVHPMFAQRLAAFGVRWQSAELLERGASSVRLLSSYDVIHLNLFQPRTQVALAAYAALPAKVLYVAHSDHLPPGRESPLTTFRRRALDQVSMLRVHSLGGVSNYVRDREGERFGLSPERRRTLYNGVDTLRFKPPAEEKPGRSLFTAAYFQKHKGVHHLISAFAKVAVADATLTIAGDGPEAGALQEQARALGVAERVRFIGLRDDLEHQLAKTDVFVHNSHVEAFGLTIAEAMSCGRPVIASRVGGVPELVADGQSGLLLEVGDEGALTEAIERLLLDVPLRRRLGENARSRVVQQFSLRRSAIEHLTWCEDAYAERSWVARLAHREEARADVLKIPQPPPKSREPVEVPLQPDLSEVPLVAGDTSWMDAPPAQSANLAKSLAGSASAAVPAPAPEASGSSEPETSPIVPR